MYQCLLTKRYAHSQIFLILFKNISIMFHILFQIEYLNNYHVKCLEVLKPLLQGPENIQALKWLEKQTLPISRPNCNLAR